MREQHLSDEAVAAFADDVLSGGARERARRHTAACPECNHAVAVQREAVWALRSASAPPLPLGLLDRLRDVPATTPVHRVPTVLDDHGTTMFAAFGAPMAALVPPAAPTRPAGPTRPTAPPKQRGRGARPFALTAAGVAIVGALAGTAVASDSAPAAEPNGVQPATVQPAEVQVPGPGTVPQSVDAQLARVVVPVRAW